MKRQVRIVLLDDAETEYKRLFRTVREQERDGKDNTDEMRLLRSIDQKKEVIKRDPFYGDNIEKRRIPKVRYNVQNLWRVELTGYWRMLYTIKGNEA